jgi:hypothetical protein
MTAPQQSAGQKQGRPENLTNAGKGRKKGVPNKSTALLKDAILQAATAAGGKEGLVGYLTTQAGANPQAFMALLGKVLPLQLTGEDGGAIKVTCVEIVGVNPQ